MRNKIVIILAVIVIIIGGSLIFRKKDKVDDKASNLNLSVKESINCTKDKTFYFDLKGSNYYLVCLDEAEIKLGNKNYTLKDAILNNKTSMEEIVADLKETIDYNNGQATMYRDASIDLNNFVDISILKCDTESGNKDYYIGNREMQYNDKYCERVCSFTRTYYVDTITDIDEKNMILSIKDPKGNNYVQVNVKKIGKKISPKSYFEFTFERNSKQNMEGDTVESIFKNFTLINLKQTKKTGLSQTQEAICEIK